MSRRRAPPAWSGNARQRRAYRRWLQRCRVFEDVAQLRWSFVIVVPPRGPSARVSIHRLRDLGAVYRVVDAARRESKIVGFTSTRFGWTTHAVVQCLPAAGR